MSMVIFKMSVNVKDIDHKKLFYLAILTELHQSFFIDLNYTFLMAERVGWLSLPSVCNGKLSEKRSRMEQEVSCI